MKVIGLTGGIGSGKSTVAGLLKELGAAAMDLDKVGHDVQKKGGGAYPQILAAFGGSILSADGEIDRAKLGAIVFNDAAALQKLDAIIHPVIDKVAADAIERFRCEGFNVVVIEAAAMLESRRGFHVDEVWVTIAPEAVVLSRLKTRSGYSEKESLARIRSQMKNVARIKRADVVIDTDCSLKELKIRVKVEWDKLLIRL
jgi:dephospho-CoA kinase